MARTFFLIGSIAAGMAVMLGAFGAHLLVDRVTPERLQTFETGIRYQMYHALGLLFLSWAVTQWPSWQVTWAGYLFITGMLLFSGSLYILVLTDTSWLGAITPIGGLSFIMGWVLLVWAVFKDSQL